ncbi:U1 zinc finger-domain-containing protein, partial [Chytriomyces sp. MP71]
QYYCDYCDIFLTHDSPSVRKAHNAGWKHKMHVQNYYQGLAHEKVKEIQDILTKAYEGKMGGPGEWRLFALTII